MRRDDQLIIRQTMCWYYCPPLPPLRELTLGPIPFTQPELARIPVTTPQVPGPSHRSLGYPALKSG
jgi:hypothetical protein